MAGKKDSGIQLRLDNMRLSYNDLWQPATGKDDEGKPTKPAYTAQLLTPKGSEQYQRITQTMLAVAKNEWGDNGPAVLKQLIEQQRVCFRSGDLKTTDDGAVRDGYAGNYYLSARAYVKPTIINADRSPLSEADGKPYSGCYVNVVVRIWPQKGKFGKRINAQLMGVQFARDGEAFGGGRPADVADFDNLAEFAGDADDLMGGGDASDDIAF